MFPAQIQTFPGHPELPAHLKTHRKSCQPPAPMADPKCSPRAPRELSCWSLTPLAVDPFSVKHSGELVAVWLPSEAGRGKGREGKSPAARQGTACARRRERALGAAQAELSIKPFLLCGTGAAWGQDGSTAPSEPPALWGMGQSHSQGWDAGDQPPKGSRKPLHVLGGRLWMSTRWPRRVCCGHTAV